MIAYGPAGDVEGAQVLGGVERALYELRQPRVVLGLARSLKKRRSRVKSISSTYLSNDEEWEYYD